MNTISSAKFRLTYHRLTEETEVTVNGHVIGIWRPLSYAQRVVREAGITADEATKRFAAAGKAFSAPTPQSRRDAILRKINRGG